MNTNLSYRLQFILFLLLSSALILSCGKESTITEKPNIVVVVVDDLGWMDIGANGSRYFETPNIDQLSREGMRFTNNYAACAVCSPTRAALMTGRYPARLGITDWIHTNHKLAKQAIAEGRHPEGFDTFPKRKLKTPINKMWLDHDEITIAEMLKPLGYATGYVGKWHLGFKNWYPDQQGFDKNMGGYEMGQPPGYFDPFDNKRQPGIPTLAPRKTGEYLTDREADEAVAFIKENKDRPFLLYMAHYAVHTPIQAKEMLVEKYRNKPGTNQTSPTYAAMVESVDQAMGAVMKTLRELELDEKTIVLFTSDNGGASHVNVDGGKATSNAPLRQGKGFSYEGGIRVPLIVSWPEKIKAGTISDTPVSSIDLFPTLSALTGAAMPNDRIIDGMSLAPVLFEEGELDRTTLYWHFPHYWWGKHVRPYSIIREGAWKMIYHYENREIELFNLADDVGEKNNLADKNPEKVTHLREKLNKWLASTGAKMPVENPDYNE